MGYLTGHGEGTVLRVRVTPRASRAGVGGVTGEAVKIRLTAPPVEGAANRALRIFLAERLGVGRNRVRLLGGERGRMKRVLVVGVGADAVREALEGGVFRGRQGGGGRV